MIREDEPCGICTFDRRIFNIYRKREVLNLNGKRFAYSVHFALIVFRAAIQLNRIANAEHRLKAHAKFANLIQVLGFIGLANITEALQIRLGKRSAVVKHFETIRILDKFYVLCASVLSILKKLIHKMRFVGIKLDDSFKRPAQHTFSVLIFNDFFGYSHVKPRLIC